MAYESIWYFTDLPKKVVDILTEDLEESFDDKMSDSKLMGNHQNKERRNSSNAWIPTHHWIGGFVWSYIERANRENFLYDLRNIDGESIQYTQYEEGQFYGWHCDADIGSCYKPTAHSNHNTNELIQDYAHTNIELIRKLSFVVQLSDPDDYEGGNLQLMNGGQSYIAPRQRGTIILFDSRIQHRVLKVTKGVRKSLVGWTVGPRWK